MADTFLEAIERGMPVGTHRDNKGVTHIVNEPMRFGVSKNVPYLRCNLHTAPSHYDEGLGSAVTCIACLFGRAGSGA